MNQKFEALMQHVEKMQALGAAMTLFSWDAETGGAPKDSMDLTSRIVGSLSSQYFEAMVNDEVRSLLKDLKDAEDLTEVQAAIVREMVKNLEDMEKIPPEEYREFSELQAKSTIEWAKAKQNNDYEAFVPTLEKIVSFSKKFAGYSRKDGQSLYDAMLDEYEESFLQEVVDPFFASLKENIVPLLKKVAAKNDTIDKSALQQPFDVDKQKELNRWLAEYIGFDFDKGILAESEHPFTTGLHNHDVRITSHYYEDAMESAIFSTIHEGGHAIYEMNVDDELTLTPVGGGASCGMHESQSRFMENMIGRSRAFWEPIYGKVQEMFPEQLGDVSLDAFVKMINKAEPGLIRTESDELTYCLHVMIRYEIEKELIDGDLTVEELPKVWNEKYEAYLGVKPETDSEGVLQDIHWSQGSIGYFPSYALGNAFAAQIYHTMEQEIDIDGALRAGDLKIITDWLKEKIHRFGQVKKSRQLLKDVTGEDFNPQYYIDYLTEKFTEVYDL